ncbi:hypothetical protein ABPG74_019572 [Tetrahymena malaccensis]
MEVHPWTILMQNRYFLQWQDLQTKVNSAALLSPKLDKAGFYLCPANYNLDVLYELSEIEFQGQNIDLQSENLDCLISEFIDLIEKSKLGNKSFKIVSVNEKVLSEVNKFILSRGAQIRYDSQLYQTILNLNLQLVTTKISKDILPSSQNLSIELLYGFMIAHYGQEILQKCPQLAILMVTTPFFNGIISNMDLTVGQPKLRKLKSLLKKISQLKNIPFFKKIQKKVFIDAFYLKEYLEKKLNKIKDEKKYSKKSKNRLLKIIYNINKYTQLKQKKYEVRLSIFNLSTFGDQDYRLQDKWECLFYMGLKQALNRVQTCISILNNQTLRNPQRHLLYPFLQSMNFSAIKKLIAMDSEQIPYQLQKIALITREARKYRYFKSDWQNKIARVWNHSRNNLLKQIKEDKELKKNGQTKSLNSSQKPLIPPPMQYYLAMDLCPYSYPFAYTFKRKQGYCLDVDGAVSWFTFNCNKSEKAYFYSILEKPEISEKFDFMYEIPPQIRVFKPKQQSESQFITRLNSWLMNNSDNQELEIIQIIQTFLKDRYFALPKSRQLFCKLKTYVVSIVSLFNLIFHLYPTEELYLDKVSLEKPFKYDNIDSVPQSAKQDKILDQNLYWGPAKYGGAVQQSSNF